MNIGMAIRKLNSSGMHKVDGQCRRINGVEQYKLYSFDKLGGKFIFKGFVVKDQVIDLASSLNRIV